jgi:hypothetical protein
MKTSTKLLGAVAFFILGSAPQLAQAQLEFCVATYTDFEVNTAEGEVVAWAWVEDYFSGGDCFTISYFQWGFWAHAYFASASIVSPTQRSAYYENFTDLIAYGGGSASASTFLSYIDESGEYDIEWVIWIYCILGEYFVSHFDGQVVYVPQCTSSDVNGFNFHKTNFYHRFSPYPARYQFANPQPNTFHFGFRALDFSQYVPDKTPYDDGADMWNTTDTMCGETYTSEMAQTWTTGGAFTILYYTVTELEKCGQATLALSGVTDEIRMRCVDQQVAAHEYGHVVGLVDRPNSGTDDIMCTWSCSSNKLVQAYHIRALLHHYYQHE